MFIEEEHYSDANFVVASIMFHCITKEKGKIILVKCHHSMQHYRNLIGKLGLIPPNVDEKPKVISLEILDYFKENGDFNAKELLRNIREHCEQNIDSITYLVIDNFSYIFLLSSFFQTVHFGRCCAKLLTLFSNLRVVISSHVSHVDEEMTRISRFFYILSDFIISTIPLKSGFSRDVSGHLKITSKEKHKAKVTEFCYRINDKKLTLSPLTK